MTAARTAPASAVLLIATLITTVVATTVAGCGAAGAVAVSTSRTAGAAAVSTSPTLGSRPAAFTAGALCRRALHVVVPSATLTTVGRLRAASVGGPAGGPGGRWAARPGRGAFPGLAGTARAAWCWTRRPGRSTLGVTWVCYGVSADGRAVQFLTVTGPGPRTPSGPPLDP